MKSETVDKLAFIYFNSRLEEEIDYLKVSQDAFYDG